jgi:hypothetical protein
VLVDLVVDTNVFVHAHNSEQAYSKDSLMVANALLEPGVGTSLRVDPGFSPVEAQNRSKIGSEYFQWLVPGMVGHHLIQELAATKRLIPVVLPTANTLKGRVRELVQDASDRVFLLTALASDDRILVSHDDEAFPDSVRSTCAEDLLVKIYDAPDVVPLIVAS